VLASLIVCIWAPRATSFEFAMKKKKKILSAAIFINNLASDVGFFAVAILLFSPFDEGFILFVFFVEDDDEKG